MLGLRGHKSRLFDLSPERADWRAIITKTGLDPAWLAGVEDLAPLAKGSCPAGPF